MSPKLYHETAHQTVWYEVSSRLNYLFIYHYAKAANTSKNTHIYKGTNKLHKIY